MTDIYDAFADAYQKETLGRSAPPSKTKKLFGGVLSKNKVDLEQSVPSIKQKNIYQKQVSQYDRIKGKLFNYEQNDKSKGVFVLINKNASSPDYKKAFISFAIGGFFFLMALFNLPSIILSP